MVMPPIDHPPGRPLPPRAAAVPAATPGGAL